jgi:hypothetical protein
MTTPIFQWLIQQPTFNTSQLNYWPSIGLDVLGNSYVCYYTDGVISGQTNTGSYDIVVFKLDSKGHMVWIRQQPSFNTSGFEALPRITTDSLGNSYIAYEGDTPTSEQTQTGLSDIIVFKLDTNGNTLWIRQQPSFNTIDWNTNTAITCDPQGNVYVGYSSAGTVSGQTYTGGNDDIIIFKLDTDGNFQWTRQNSSFNTTLSDATVAITSDLSGNVYFAYDTNGVASGATNTGSRDIVIGKLNTNGDTIWVRQNPSFDTVGFDESCDITCDAIGNVYLIYATNGTASGQTNTGLTDVVIVKLDTDGNTIWVRQQPSFNTDDNDFLPAIASDPIGNVYATYVTHGTTSGQTLSAGVDLAITKLDTDGNTQFVLQQPFFNATGDNDSYVPRIAVDSRGNIYITNTTSGTNTGQTNTGGQDIVVFKFFYPGEERPSISSDTTDNLYLTYYTNGTITGQPSTERSDIVIVKKNSNGDTLWIQRDPVFNGVNSNRDPVIVTTIDGCYVVYQTDGTTSGAFTLFPDDLVVLKLDSLGAIQWVRQQPSFNTTRSDQSPTADVDSLGNLYVAYQTYGRASGGYRTSLKDRTDIVIFKMDPSGNVLWIKQSKTFNSFRGNYAPHLKCDQVNNLLYLADACEGRITGQQFSGEIDIVLVKMDLDGQVLTLSGGAPWVLQQPTFNTTFVDDEPVITIDSLGYLYLCYTTVGGAVSGQSNTGLADLVICKIDPLGQVIKVIQNNIFNTPDDDLHPSITYRSGFIYVSYQTYGAVSGQSHIGQADIVVIKINTVTLDVVWIRQTSDFNSTFDEIYPRITTDSGGNCYVAYSTNGTLMGLSPSMVNTVVLCRINTDGTFGWVKR